MTTMHESRTLGGKPDNGAAVAEDLRTSLKHGAEELIESGQETVDNLRAKVRGQVRDRPMTSLVVAGGIGLLLGLLIARKR